MTLLTPKDLEARGIPVRTQERWRAIGDGPPYARLGPRRIVYPADLFEQWLRGRTFASHAAERAGQPVKAA